MEDLDVNGIILKWIFKTREEGAWAGYGQVVVAGECGNTPLGSIKCGVLSD